MDSSPSCHKGAQEKEQGHLTQRIEDLCIVAFYLASHTFDDSQMDPFN